MRVLHRLDVLVAMAATVVLLGGTAAGLPFSYTEDLGFLTGGLSVWLVVVESVWTWPVGIANNVFFAILFWRARLFADMGLQWVYVALAVWGWWFWLRGGVGRTPRVIGRSPALERAAVGMGTCIATLALTGYLRSVGDAAPFLDALTTALSLAATYLLARKLVENWWLWIAADVVYVPLYIWKGLPLTGALYVVFLAMCVRGVRAWTRSAPRAQSGLVAVAADA